MQATAGGTSITAKVESMRYTQAKYRPRFFGSPCPQGEWSSAFNVLFSQVPSGWCFQPMCRGVDYHEGRLLPGASGPAVMSLRWHHHPLPFMEINTTNPSRECITESLLQINQPSLSGGGPRVQDIIRNRIWHPNMNPPRQRTASSLDKCRRHRRI